MASYIWLVKDKHSIDGELLLFLKEPIYHKRQRWKMKSDLFPSCVKGWAKKLNLNPFVRGGILVERWQAEHIYPPSLKWVGGGRSIVKLKITKVD